MLTSGWGNWFITHQKEGRHQNWVFAPEHIPEFAIITQKGDDYNLLPLSDEKCCRTFSFSTFYMFFE